MASNKFTIDSCESLKTTAAPGNDFLKMLFYTTSAGVSGLTMTDMLLVCSWDLLTVGKI